MEQNLNSTHVRDDEQVNGTPTTQRSTVVAGLAQLYDRPGPFLSSWVPTGSSHAIDGAAAFAANQATFLDRGASPASIDATAARLGLPSPEDMGGHAVFAAADGTTISSYGTEGPSEPFFRLDSLPYAAPLLEWEQSSVAHLFVECSQDAYDIALIAPQAKPDATAVGDLASARSICKALIEEHACELIVIFGEQGVGKQQADALSAALIGHIPVRCEVRVIEPDGLTQDQLADEIVRQVSDTVARRTVQTLQDFRFMTTHGGAVDGAEATCRALSDGNGITLLVHDDPRDDRRAFFGRHPHQLSLTKTAATPTEGRLVDVAIRSAILSGVAVRIVPSTGPNGPEEDIGLIVAEADISPT